MGKKKESPLPKGYTKFDWIRSDGSAEAVLDVLSTSVGTLEVDMSYNEERLGSKTNLIFGRSEGLGKYNVAIVGGIGNMAVRSFYNGASGAGSRNVTSDGQRSTFRFHFKAGSQLLEEIRGGVVIRSVSGTQTDSGLVTGRAYIFGPNPLPKIYKAVAYSDYEATEKIAEYCACTRDSDGEVGIFDLILQKFYPNTASSGSFTVGND